MNNQFGSDPNHLPEVQLRGSANLPTITDLQDQTNTDLNTPLIILDGFEITLTRMMDLNTEEVESITLLKDGSATAIYGSRGANGVIVITRRAPQAGKLQFTYTGSLNLEVPDLTGYHLLDAAQKLELERRSGYYDSSDPTRNSSSSKSMPACCNRWSAAWTPTRSRSPCARAWDSATASGSRAATTASDTR